MTAQGDPLVWESFLWGLVSAISLNIGSLVGVTCLPRKKVRAMLMSFGGGSLLFALSIELFGHVLSRSEQQRDSAPVWIMEGSAILGGILFALLNKALNAHGADVRKPSTTKGRMARLRGELMGRLAHRIWQIPFFSEITLPELKELIQSAMSKERYRTGDIIISHETRDSGIFFIVSGMVRVYIAGDQDGSKPPPSPQAIRDLRDVEAAAHHAPQLQKHHLLVPVGGGTSGPDAAAPKATAAEKRCWDLGPDKVFGDMALLAGSHMGVTAIALESTKVLVLPCHEVMHLVDRSANVRHHVSLRALENLRQLESFKSLPNSVVHSLLGVCPLETFQPGEVVFEGTVGESTPVMSVIFGLVEVTFHQDRSRTTIHGSSLLCADHFRGHRCQAFTATAVEATSVLVVPRQDLDQAVCGGSTVATVTVSTQRLSVGSGAKQPLSVESGPKRLSVDSISAAGPDDAAGPGCGRRPDAPSVVCVPPAASGGDARQQGGAALRKEGSSGKIVQVMPLTPLGINVQASLRKEAPNILIHAPVVPGQVDDEKPARPSLAWGLPSLAGVEPAALGSNDLCSLGKDLGWDQEESFDVDYWDRLHLLPAEGSSMEDIGGLVTDQDLEEREQDIADLRNSVVRSSSKGSSRSHNSRRRPEDALTVPAPQPHASEGDGEMNTHAHGQGAHAAIMVWLGILIDAVPESLVIGILINKSAIEGSDSSAAEAALPFVIGVFLSNLPESMSSSGSMKAHGIQVRNILLMWLTITFLTAVGAAAGALLFPPGSSQNPATELVVSGVEGLAAGAMLTMIAQTMLPEAFEQGGDVVGLSCLGGFLCALSVKLIPFSSGAGH